MAWLTWREATDASLDAMHALGEAHALWKGYARSPGDDTDTPPLLASIPPLLAPTPPLPPRKGGAIAAPVASGERLIVRVLCCERWRVAVACSVQLGARGTSRRPMPSPRGGQPFAWSLA